MALQALSRVTRLGARAPGRGLPPACTLAPLWFGIRWPCEKPEHEGGPHKGCYARAQAQLTIARGLHVTRARDSSLIVAGIGVAGVAVAGHQGLKAYQQWQESRPKKPEGDKVKSDAAGSLFGSFGKRHYDGGFEEKMTRREAALILGVRESATPQRIKDAHRRILMLNHPDKGGSKYIAAKINEAKELLMKGRE